MDLLKVAKMDIQPVPTLDTKKVLDLWRHEISDETERLKPSFISKLESINERFHFNSENGLEDKIEAARLYTNEIAEFALQKIEHSCEAYNDCVKLESFTNDFKVKMYELLAQMNKDISISNEQQFHAKRNLPNFQEVLFNSQHLFIIVNPIIDKTINRYSIFCDKKQRIKADEHNKKSEANRLNAIKWFLNHKTVTGFLVFVSGSIGFGFHAIWHWATSFIKH